MAIEKDTVEREARTPSERFEQGLDKWAADDNPDLREAVEMNKARLRELAGEEKV